jgi:hypothetical protein
VDLFHLCPSVDVHSAVNVVLSLLQLVCFSPASAYTGSS